ncbi:brct domain-containing protein [Stemphylium lycopersici]|uniref:Brct domain-containing protein n=1 Tax=Stemphylium lycopersici TaxID=183478 RepID=A0A364NE59_STELY|nr:brct domain-containing protein [Stemphylium lycopersici]
MWASVVSHDSTGMQQVIAGGADSKITATPLPRVLQAERNVPSDVAEYTIDDILAWAQSATPRAEDPTLATAQKSSKKSDFFRSYCFVDESTFLLTTNFGKVLVASLASEPGRHDPSLLSSSTLLGRLQDLSGYSVCTSSSRPGIAFIAGANGSIYTYRKSVSALTKLHTMEGKVGDIFAADVSDSASTTETVLLVTLAGQGKARLLYVDPNQSTEILNDVHVPITDSLTGSVVTSMAHLRASGSNFIVVGFRRGSIALYGVHANEGHATLLRVMENVHHGEAVTSLAWAGTFVGSSQAHLHSVGRDGRLTVHHIDLTMTSVTLVHDLALPFGPNLEGLYLQEDRLLVHGFSSKKWYLYDVTAEEEVMSIDTGGAHRSWAFRSHSSLGESTGPRTRLIATGAEDTDIKIFQYVNQNLVCRRTIRKHTTGIQHLQWSVDGEYLFSSGGCEEFYVWRIRNLPSSSLDIGVVCEHVYHPESEHADLRIMAFDVTSRGTAHFVTMVFSDSSIKAYRYDSTATTKWKALARGIYFTSCLTQCVNLSPTKILTAGTDGHAVTWPLPEAADDLSAGSASSISELTWHHPAKIHQNSSKVMTTQVLDDDRTLIVSGGDDGSLAFIFARSAPSISTGSPATSYALPPIIVNRAHASAVTACAMYRRGTQLILLTSGNDEWIRLWEITVGDGDKEGGNSDAATVEDALEIRRLYKAKTNVADVSSMAVLEVHGGTSSAEILICGVGMERTLIHIMVATRRGAKEAPEAPSNTLNAPPKRGGRKKAVVEEAAEPAPAPAKPTKTTAAKRKAQAEPEDAEPPAAKRTVATKTTRTTKVQTKAEPAPAAPKRATRGRKAEEPAAVEEAEAVEEAPKPATTRTRKIAAVKKSAAPKVDNPVAAEEPATEEPVVEEVPKSTSRARKAPAKKTPASKKAEPPVVEEPVAVEPAKPATRTRKPAVPKASAAPAPVLAPRATRGRTAPAVSQESPLKAPARKPAKKAVAAAASTPIAKTEPEQVEEVAEEVIDEAAKEEVQEVAEAPAEVQIEQPAEEPVAEPAVESVDEITAEPADEPVNESTAEQAVQPAEKPIEESVEDLTEAPLEEPVKELAEEPMAEFPGYPTTPAHIAAPITSEKAMAQLPDYPSTPSHIAAPISNKDALAELADYPKTPAHIAAPISSKDALAEMPEYPKTPAHINAPINTKDALAEMPDYPETPAHIKAPISVKDAMAEMPDYPKTPAHITAPVDSFIAENDTKAVEHEYQDVDMEDVEMEDIQEPSTEDSEACITSNEDTAATPAPADVPEGPQNIATPAVAEQKCGEEPPAAAEAAATPVAKSPVSAQTETPYNAATPFQESPADVPGTPPAQIVWGVTDQEAFEELPAAYPNTPAHIAAPVTTKEAMAELPGYPKTPAHITAPITPRRALAELPDYPTTPSLALEAAIQEEITASVKKQTPSPRHYQSLNEDVSFGFEETSEIADISEVTEVSEFSEVAVESTTKGVSFSDHLKLSMPLKPLQLAPTFAAPEPASPKKSALRSPQKVTDAKTPKKSVAWTDVQADESDLFLHDDGILQGMVFYVDVTRNGREQNFLFQGLLEDLGAKVVKDISHASLTHVLFKDGSMSTLEKCLASKGAIKCVNVGWVLDSESNKKRMDEEPYMVDLSVAKPASPLPTNTMKPFTPAKTPSKYALPPSSQCKMPSTPTSSEFDRSFNDDKENSEIGAFFDKSPIAPRTVPNKKSSFLFSKSAVKTPSKPLFLATTPSKQSSLSAMKPAPQAFSTTKRRPAESSFFNSSLGPPRKLRLF